MEPYVSAEERNESSAPLWKLVLFGVLPFWAPYIFVWFVLNPTYPKWYRLIVIGWTVAWVSFLLSLIGAWLFDPNYRG
jgi:hypothetical protein